MVYGVCGDSSVPASFDTSRGSSMRDIFSETLSAAGGSAVGNQLWTINEACHGVARGLQALICDLSSQELRW